MFKSLTNFKIDVSPLCEDHDQHSVSEDSEGETPGEHSVSKDSEGETPSEHSVSEDSEGEAPGEHSVSDVSCWVATWQCFYWLLL